MPTNAAPIKVMVIDDSAVVRKHLTEMLEAGGLEVIGSASDPLFAWPKMAANWPDVVVLDVEMPRMDGITFLRKIMAERPTPVVMCSTLTAAGAQTTLQALSEGAVSFVTKPTLGLRDFLTGDSNGLVAAVRSAARAHVQTGRRSPAQPTSAVNVPVVPLTGPAVVKSPLAMAETTDRIVAVGSSTGGVQAIEILLGALPRTSPGILIVQHMPERFTAALAERLDKLCKMDVKEAVDGDRVLNGRVLIAPGGKHLQLTRSGAQYVVQVRDGPLVNRHKPSVDVLFKSVAQTAGANAAGIILTGMGDDGARGLLAMRDAGATTVAQDEASCVVFGMPKEAIKMGAAGDVVPLGGISSWITRWAQQGQASLAR